MIIQQQNSVHLEELSACSSLLKETDMQNIIRNKKKSQPWLVQKDSYKIVDRVRENEIRQKHTNTQVRTCMHVHTQTHHTHGYTWIHIQLCTNSHMHKHVPVCVACIHAHTHREKCVTDYGSSDGTKSRCTSQPSSATRMKTTGRHGNAMFWMVSCVPVDRFVMVSVCDDCTSWSSTISPPDHLSALPDCWKPPRLWWTDIVPVDEAPYMPQLCGDGWQEPWDATCCCHGLR